MKKNDAEISGKQNRQFESTPAFTDDICDGHIRDAYRRYMDAMAPSADLLRRTRRLMAEAAMAEAGGRPTLKVVPKRKNTVLPGVLTVAAAALVFTLGLAVIWPIMRSSTKKNMSPRERVPLSSTDKGAEKVLPRAEMQTRSASEETGADESAAMIAEMKMVPEAAAENEKAEEMPPEAVENETAVQESVLSEAVESAAPYAMAAAAETKGAERKMAEEAAQDMAGEADAEPDSEAMYPAAGYGIDSVEIPVPVLLDLPLLADSDAESFEPAAEYLVERLRERGQPLEGQVEFLYDESPLFRDDHFTAAFEEAVRNVFPESGSSEKPFYLHMKSAIIMDSESEFSFEYDWLDESNRVMAAENVKLQLVEGEWQVR